MKLTLRPDLKTGISFFSKGFKRILIVLAIFILSAPSLLSAESKIKDLLQNSYTPVAMGGGNTGSQTLYPFEGSHYNSSLLTSLDRQGGFLSFAYGDQLIGGGIHFAIPNAFNLIHSAISLSSFYFQSEAETGLQNYGQFSFSYARRLVHSLSFALKISPFFGNGQTALLENASYYGLGLDPSLSFSTAMIWPIQFGLGLYDLTFYLTTQNLGIYMGSFAGEIKPDISYHFGIQTGIFRLGKWGIDVLAETRAYGGFDRFPVNVGSRVFYDWFSLRAGYNFANSGSIADGLLLGFGGDFQLTNGNLFFNYGLAMPASASSQLYHFFAAGLHYGKLDTEAPIMTIKKDFDYFSPNNDGVQDYIHLSIEVEDISPIKEWKLTIFDKDQKIVKTFFSDTREKDEKFGIGDVFKHLFKKRESISVPAIIRWDGTGNTIDIKDAISDKNTTANRLLPQGQYTYSFEATDIHNNISKPVNGEMFLDITPPKILVNVERQLFSPNGDGVYDQLTILNEAIGEKNDQWSIVITDENDKVIRTFKPTADNRIPDSIIWDGKDDQGQEAKEGLYRYRISGNDFAGNKKEFQSKDITLVRTVDQVELNVSHSGFSPNGDGLFDTLNFVPVITSPQDLNFWRISITTDKPEAGKELLTNIKTWEGTKAAEIPKEIIFDGKDKNNQLMADGSYYITLDTRYNSGNHPRSFAKKFVLDTTPPRVEVEADLANFSPDGDGEKEEQVFRISIEDMSALGLHELQIFEITAENSKKVRLPAKKFAGETSFAPKVYWDGKTDQGNLVESATVYEYEMWALDVYGNKGLSRVGRFETDILVLVTERGLRIRLSNIEFGLGASNLLPQTKPLLKKLAELLKRYTKYKIRIEGHTDDLGDEEYNLGLSEQRARSVMEYIITEGVEKERLSYQGLGEIYPVVPNSNNYNRTRNRRVEFILLK